MFYGWLFCRIPLIAKVKLIVSMRKLKGQRLWYLAAIWLAVGVYAWLAARELKLPGLHYDEVIQAPAAVHLLKGNINASYNRFWSVTIAGRTLPIMTMPYMGAAEAYLYALSFSALGINVEALRTVNILLAVLALLATAHFAKTFFGPLAAIIGTWLLATDPSFVILSRSDWGPFVLSLILRLVALIGLWHWWKSGGRLPPLLVASLAMGLGLYDKTNFLWFIIAVAVFGAMVWLGSKKRPRLSFKIGALALIVGLTASAPLWIYNATHNWETFRLAALPGQPVGLAKLLEQVPPRTEALVTLLNSQVFGPALFQEAAPVHLGVAGTLMLWLSTVALLLLLALGLLRQQWPLLLLPLLSILIIGQIYLTPRPVWIHHWIGIYPFTQVMVGVVTSLIWRGWTGNERRRQATRWLGGITVLAALYFNIVMMINYQRMMVATGGDWTRSDAIYELAKTLQQQYVARPIHLLDWGLSNQLVMLSAGELRLRETFWEYAASPNPNGQLLNLVRDPANVFLLHAPPATAFPAARDAFYAAIEQAGRRVQAEREFYDRRGRAVYTLIELAADSAKPAPTAIPLMAASKSRPGVAFTATPSPIRVCDGSGLGVTALSWKAPNATVTEVHVNAPDGPLLARAGAEGKTTTHKWVTEAMVFYLQDVSGGAKPTAANTIGTVTVNLTTDGCP
jgi:hypothetical protein